MRVETVQRTCRKSGKRAWATEWRSRKGDNPRRPRRSLVGTVVKGFVKLLVVLALIVVAIWWFKPEWLPWNSRKLVVGATHEKELALPPPASAAPKLYRWKDAQGREHASDKPPTDGSVYETVQYDPDTNVIPAPQPAPPAAGAQPPPDGE